MSWLIIRHPVSQCMYAVTDANFVLIYEPLGYEAVVHEDGTAYVP